MKRQLREQSLAHQFAHHATVHIRQAHVSATESEGQLFVIQPQLMECSGVDVVNGKGVFDH